jgi:hypothetical protein
LEISGTDGVFELKTWFSCSLTTLLLAHMKLFKKLTDVKISNLDNAISCVRVSRGKRSMFCFVLIRDKKNDGGTVIFHFET